MGAGGPVRPADDSWLAAVHETESGDSVLGCGVVIDDRRILTCAGVVSREDAAGGNAPIWVAFPKAGTGGSGRRLRADRVVFPPRRGRSLDLAVLYLSGPVPAGVTPAPLRCPRPADLVSRRWWASGFRCEDDPARDAADGVVGAALGEGWVRLDTGSGYGVPGGFSGGGLWSPDYQAVVGVVGRARDGMGDGSAITLHQAGERFPAEKIKALTERWFPAQAGELALSAWGWPSDGDREGARHPRPGARGVSTDSERGHRFRGRDAALRVIRDWLDHAQPDRRVLVVTGAPGAGKSAVLGRIVATADAGAARHLPASDTGVQATTGSVACAVHAGAKTALEVATEIARAASSALPERVEDLVPALRDTLSGVNRRFNVIIDALDEAVSPAEARTIVAKVILPIAETCADTGAQVVVGSRREDAHGDLLAAFGEAVRRIDLDDTEFSTFGDLAACAFTTLQLTDGDRAANPYAGDMAAAPVAARIAELSKGNFLVARLTARSHGLYDETAVAPWALSFSPEIDDATREYLRGIHPVAAAASASAPPVSAETLLTVLAFAESPGLPADLWRTALRALGAGDIPEAVLTRFARSPAVSFLVESSGGNGRDPTFRLFHQALNEALLRSRAKVTERGDDERALTRAFLQAGRESGWERAPVYLLRSLPGHAAAGRVVDDLLADDEYLLHADLRRVLQAASWATSAAGHDRARLLRLTEEAVTAPPADRAAMFSVTEAQEGLGAAYCTARRPAPYRAHWAVTRPRSRNLTLEGAGSPLCAVTAEGRALLAAVDGGTVRLWDPASGALVRTLANPGSEVRALCAVPAEGRALLAADDGGTVRLWDPADGALVRTLANPRSRVRVLCAVPAEGRALLAAVDGGTVRLWDPADGTLVRTLANPGSEVRALCAVPAGERALLVTLGYGGVVRLWDPASGALVRTLETRRSEVLAVCAVTAADPALLATVGQEEAVRLWEPASGALVGTLSYRMRTVNREGTAMTAVCAVTAGGCHLLATIDEDGDVRLWNVAGAERDRGPVHRLPGHEGGAGAVCAVTVGERTLLATAGRKDRTVQLRDLSTIPPVRYGKVDSVCTVPAGERTLLAAGSREAVELRDPASGALVRTLRGPGLGVTAVCAVPAGGATLLAVGRDHTVELWDPASGTLARTLKGPQHWRNMVRTLCVVPAGGRPLLAVGSYRAVRLWDPADGALVRTLRRRGGRESAVCAVTDGDRTLLAVGSSGRVVRLWDPASGALVRTLRRRGGQVTAVCAVTDGDRTLLAVGSYGTVRLWDPADGALVRTLEGHESWVSSLCAVTVGGRTLLAAGSGGVARLWDPASGSCMLAVPVHHGVWDMTPVAGSLAVALGAGLITIKFESGLLAQQSSA